MLGTGVTGQLSLIVVQAVEVEIRQEQENVTTQSLPMEEQFVQILKMIPQRLVLVMFKLVTVSVFIYLNFTVSFELRVTLKKLFDLR